MEKDRSPSHRRARCALLVLAGILAIFTLAPAHAGPLEDFDRAMLSGEYERALTLAERIAREHPQSTVAAYNLACALSRNDRIEEGIEALRRSAELGFTGVRSVRDDADLGNLRAHEAFAEILEKVQANADARFERFKGAALEAAPAVRLPRNHDPKKEAPLLIVLHGTGGTGEQMANLWARSAEEVGAILIAPDALRPSGGGYSWTYRDESEWYVLHLIEEARKQWTIGPVILAGYSQGANIALMLGQSHAHVFDGVIPLNGHYEADIAALPEGEDMPKWCLLIGERDPWAATYKQAEADFEKAGMTVHRYELPRLGHGFPSGERGRRMLTEALMWCLDSRSS